MHHNRKQFLHVNLYLILNSVSHTDAGLGKETLKEYSFLSVSNALCYHAPPYVIKQELSSLKQKGLKGSYYTYRKFAFLGNIGVIRGGH